MSELSLTERQQREREYYEEYSRRNAPPEASFEPVESHERRPWNPYWFVCELVRDHFRSPEQNLLDFGCGTGYYSLIFAKMGYQVHGFDISPTNISIARQMAEKYGLAEKTNFKTSVAEHLEYPSDFSDVVVGVDILHHVDIKHSVGECLRVLKRGGIAIFKEPIEVPVFDPLRNSRFGKWLVPKSVSYERHITEDERKLNDDDIRIIRGLCPDLSIKRFRLFSRLDALIKRGTAPLEKFDERILKLMPFMKPYGGNMVLRLKKQ